MIAATRKDTNCVALDISKANRNFRQHALRRCSSNYLLCWIKIKGTIDRINDLTTIRAA